MHTAWLRQCVFLISIVLVGCSNEGFDLELHMPTEVSRIELTIDTENGVEPRKVGNRTYAIDLDEQGKATINAVWPITGWHRTFLVTPSGRMQENFDFRIVDSRWVMAKTVKRTTNGVESKTKVDGSKFWMEIKKEPVPQPNHVAAVAIRTCSGPALRPGAPDARLE